jgi:hypothetical protein
VNGAIVGYRTFGRDKGLGGYLTTENAWPVLFRIVTAEDVYFELLDV